MVRLKKQTNKGKQKELITDNCKIAKRLPYFLFNCDQRCKFRVKPADHLRRNGLHCAYQKNIDLKDRTETQAQRRLRLWHEGRRNRPYPRRYSNTYKKRKLPLRRR